MRAAVLIAVPLLVAGCFHATVSQPGQTRTTRSGSRASSASTTAPSQPALSSPPRDGAPVSDVIRWTEAGRPADAADYHSATRDGETTELGDDIAFTTPAGPSGATTCRTDSRHTGGALACLVDLADPPARPEAVYGEWKGNWVDFDGVTLQVGSAHSDPGPFGNGDGPELPNGAALSFGDYRCRTDRADLFCVNYAHRSAARFSSTGIEPFGCLRPVPPPAGVGKLFSC
jgi:hypothetical protein